MHPSTSVKDNTAGSIGSEPALTTGDDPMRPDWSRASDLEAKRLDADVQQEHWDALGSKL